MSEDVIGHAPPLVERRGVLKLVGICRRYRLMQDLPGVLEAVAGQWREFHACEHKLGRTGGSDYYGVCLRVVEGEASFGYFCGMARAGDPPEGFAALVIPPLRCAVFRHTGSTDSLPAAYFTIFGRLLPEAGLSPADAEAGAPEFIERFDEHYDLKTGTGGPEILVPLKE